MRTLKFKSRPFFAAVNQMFGGFSQLTTTAEHCFVVWTVHSDLITARSAVVGGWNIWLTVAKNAFVGWALNFRVRILLKGAVSATVLPEINTRCYPDTRFHMQVFGFRRVSECLRCALINSRTVLSNRSIFLIGRRNTFRVWFWLPFVTCAPGLYMTYQEAINRLIKEFKFW